MNKKLIINILSVLLIIGGIAVALYPTIDEYVTKYYNEKLMEDYQMGLDAVGSAEAGDILGVLEDFEYDEQASKDFEFSYNQYGKMMGMELGTETEPITTAKPRPNLNVIGTIKIPKINLALPVLDKVTEANLTYGAAHIDGTSAVGVVGNAGIAAHRGRSYGLLFNRLHELGKGDSIFVNYGGKKMEYVIFNVSVVEPTEVSVLNRSRTEKVLTLVTCEPIVNPTHRLIVHALQKPVN